MLRKTQNQSDHRTSNLWLGFGLGITITATLGFFLGTKKGREMLKKLLEVTENLEENLLTIGEELEEELMEKSEEMKKDLKSLPTESTLRGVRERIKNRLTFLR